VAKRSRRSSRRSRSPRRRGWVRLRPWVLLVAGGAFAFAITSFLLLDVRVRAQFGRTQWRLPAHVYSQPLDLYQGRYLSEDQLVDQLQALGYRQDGALDKSGHFDVHGRDVDLHTRGFGFPDGREPERRLRVRFAGSRIAAAHDAAGGDVIARLEPQRIGSVYPGRQEDRVLVRLGDVPPELVAALLAVEDRDFFEHWGVEPTAILRAMVANLRAGHTVQGGSTLTQQLVKNFFLSNERTLSRKFTEALMALSVEWHYSKEQILEAYLNEVYLGQDGQRAIHGFGLGARFWFNRPLDELDLHEIALLVGLVKGPSYYDPREHPRRALERRNTVLAVLAHSPSIGEARARAAMEQPLDVVDRDAVQLQAYPAYMDLVRSQLARDYREQDLKGGGLRVFTYLDPQVQGAAEAAVRERLEALDPGGRKQLQAAAVVADTATGAVQAVVGDREPRRAGYNRAVDARRSIGSLVKPAVYLTALSRPDAYTLVTPISDAPLQVKLDNRRTWSPENYDHRNHGRIPLIDGLVHSYNVATARLGLDLGLDQVETTLERLDVGDPDGIVPADLLGALSLSPLEVADMYQTLGAGGFDAPLNTIDGVEGPGGAHPRRYGLDVHRVLDPEPVFLVDAAMAEVARRGTASALRQRLPDRDVAGKTGTTDALRDSWFAGFDGRRTAVVWVGRDDDEPAGLTGAAGALRVWADMMHSVPPAPRRASAPAGIEWARVDPDADRTLPSGCTDAPRLPFIEGSLPPRAQHCGGGEPLGGR